MAHKKAGSTASTNRDSVSKRLGVKRFGGEIVDIGEILVRQKGSHFYPGSGTKQGNDFTIYATSSGKVYFGKKRGRQVIFVHE